MTAFRHRHFHGLPTLTTLLFLPGTGHSRRTSPTFVAGLPCDNPARSLAARLASLSVDPVSNPVVFCAITCFRSPRSFIPSHPTYQYLPLLYRQVCCLRWYHFSTPDGNVQNGRLATHYSSKSIARAPFALPTPAMNILPPLFIPAWTSTPRSCCKY